MKKQELCILLLTTSFSTLLPIATGRTLEGGEMTSLASDSTFIFMNDNHKKFSIDELQALNQKFDQQLKELQTGDKTKAHSSSYSFRKLVFKALLLVLILIAPFIVLIRVSVTLYLNYQLNGWIALSSGIAATVLLLIGYALFLGFKYKKVAGIQKYIRRGIAGLVIAYTLYGLLYYSSMNTKSAEIKSYYRSLHPIMRVALTTVTLADSDLLVTDIQREPEDYAQMGLPENSGSLHYVQSNGYVHAVDLRTKGRSEWKNWLTQITVSVIGLQTIRHVGTADHLHIYLPLN